MERAIFINSEVKSWHEAAIHPFNFSMMYGVGVFEGIRVYKTTDGRKAFKIIEHIDRLFESAKILNLKIEFTKKKLLENIKLLMNEISSDNVYIRPMIYCDGDGFLGLRAKTLTTHLVIAAITWQYSASKEQKKQGLNIITSHLQKGSPNSGYFSAKANGNYLPNIIALQESKNLGVDDVIFCDQNGFVTEASGANIFFVKNKKLFTSSTVASLNGITRTTIFKIADVLGLTYEVLDFKKEDLYCADEIFLVGTAMEIMAVTQIDQRKISNGYQGELTKEISKQYENVVSGKSPQYQEWLTLV